MHGSVPLRFLAPYCPILEQSLSSLRSNPSLAPMRVPQRALNASEYLPRVLHPVFHRLETSLLFRTLSNARLRGYRNTAKASLENRLRSSRNAAMRGWFIPIKISSVKLRFQYGQPRFYLVPPFPGTCNVAPVHRARGTRAPDNRGEKIFERFF